MSCRRGRRRRDGSASTARSGARGRRPGPPTASARCSPTPRRASGSSPATRSRPGPCRAAAVSSSIAGSRSVRRWSWRSTGSGHCATGSAPTPPPDDGDADPPPPRPARTGRALYSPEVVEDSSAAFARIREAGPAVWLSRQRMWAMGRFDEVRAALRDDELFVSGKGVAANPITNVAARKTTLFSDGETHVARRKALMRSLGAQAMAPISGRLDAEAEAIVGRLVGRGEFDASRDFSSGLPLEVVADLVGVRVPAERLLSWGTISFDVPRPLK